MGPEKPLPYDDAFQTADVYVDSLLDFVGHDELLRTLCGGVHVLDFFTSDPDLYSRVLSQEWRDFFAGHEIMDILDLLMREDLNTIPSTLDGTWRDGPLPPESLLRYIQTVRKHSLDRKPKANQCARNRAMKSTQKLARHVVVGMTVKKVHEVALMAKYLDDLASSIATSSTLDSSDADARNGRETTHLVDFGSGQNYLGRALASEPYNRSIVAIESKSHNAERAKAYDVRAKLAEKERFMRNKKAFRAGLEGPDFVPQVLPPTPPPEKDTLAIGKDSTVEIPKDASGSVQYVEHRIQNGDLSDVISKIDTPDPNLMVISLHSCGNLVHHGLRSLILNLSVKAVAMVGCCHNLLTSRLGRATYKLPELRPTTHAHPRLVGKHGDGEKCDPNGFPMSERLCTYSASGNREGEVGIHLNITGRMMAVQAPQNWGPNDSAAFFTRHFYRALLQRLFLDHGVVGPPSTSSFGGSPAGHSSDGTPIIIGSLRKGCYNDFVSYVRGALEKLHNDEVLGPLIGEKMTAITDAEIAGYEQGFKERKKDLSVIWSLMAFSAEVVEAAIVVDRWLWLREQKEVKAAWVEPVFEYAMSPRNLVIVGIKK